MSITSGGTRKAGPYTGNGSITSFPFSFKVFQASDLLVVQTDSTPTDYALALNTHYTVTLNANQDSNPGGTVNMLVAPPAGYLLTIGSQLPQLQSVTLTNNGGFYPTVINNALDYLTILVQQVSEKLGRALTLPFSTNSSVSTQLPPVSPGSMLGWKSDGSGIANLGATGVGAGGIVAANMALGATGTALSTDTQAAATKTTPVDADDIPLFDSASFWGLKSLTWANLKATLWATLHLFTVKGDQFQISTDLSPFREGTADAITSGTLFNLVGAPVMKYWSHNVTISVSGTVGTIGNASETGVCIIKTWDENNLERVWYANGTAGVAPTFGATPLYALDLATGNLSANAASVIQPIAASVASNALTVTLNPTVLDFRSATLGSGANSRLALGVAISLTVPSGATLGTVNATPGRLILLAINNAGTMELAIVNQAGGVNLDETTLISTTAISAAATASNVIYSTTARTNVVFRVVGYIEITEATVGTWASAPSLVQGYGGQSAAAM